MHYLRNSLFAVVMMIVACGFLIKASRIKKDVEIARSQIVINTPSQERAAQAGSADLITVKQFIEGAIAKNNLPLYVTTHNGSELVITAKNPDAERSNTSVSDPLMIKRQLFSDHRKVLNLFSQVSNLPYAINYRSACVGLDCPDGFEATIQFTKAAAPPPPPPAAPTSH